MPEALLHLAIAKKSPFNCPKIRGCFAPETVSLPFISNKVQIPRMGDTFVPEFICSSSSLKAVNFLYMGNLLYRFPLDFCATLAKNEASSVLPKCFVYKLPWKLLNIPPLYAEALGLYVSVELEAEGKVEGAELLGTYLLLDKAERDDLRTKPHELQITQIVESNCLDLSEGCTSVEIKSDGIIKGFFFEGPSLEEVEKLELFFNEYTRFSYCKKMLSLYIQRINSKLWYFSLDSLPFADPFWKGHINLGKIDQINIKITTLSPSPLRMYTLSANLFRICDGLAGCAFGYSYLSIALPNSSFPVFSSLPPVILPPKLALPSLIYKLLEGDPLCAITLEPLGADDRYMSCPICKKNFDDKTLLVWLVSKPSCPACRSPWKKKQIYANEPPPGT